MLSTIWLVIVVSFSLFCLSDYVKPAKGSARNSRELVVGILGLALGAMHLRRVYSLVFASLPHSAVLFRLVQAIVTGVWAGILLSMGHRRWAKSMLILAGIFFFGSPLAVAFALHLAGHQVSLGSVLALPNIFITEIFAVALAVPAIVLLLGSDDNDGGLAVEDEENGTEA
jgi:hypothetical protein